MFAFFIRCCFCSLPPVESLEHTGGGGDKRKVKLLKYKGAPVLKEIQVQRGLKKFFFFFFFFLG